jgi:hypothetical protein
MWIRYYIFVLLRYYAGNWPCSVVLIRKTALAKLGRLVKVSDIVQNQVSAFFDAEVVDTLAWKMVAFRALHLTGRVLPTLAERCLLDLKRHDSAKSSTSSIDDYIWLDGEIWAGMALGYNFGDGYLHDDTLLKAVQCRAGFELGECISIWCDSIPTFGFGKDYMHFTVTDATGVQLSTGRFSRAQLTSMQP